MAQPPAQQMRAWQGPALFSYGFRHFFLFGSVFARLWASIGPEMDYVSGILWLAAFVGFALCHGPLLLHAKPENRA